MFYKFLVLTKQVPPIVLTFKIFMIYVYCGHITKLTNNNLVMEYTLNIEIKLPRNQVVEKFNNEENMKHWQKGFVSMEHINGIKGKTGAISKLIYKMGKREIEMIETITLLDLPESFHLTFDAKNVYNIQENYFEELSNGNTKWVSKNEFKFSGFMKLMGFLMPGAFKKQSYEYMVDFKAFAEEGKSVLDN